MDEKNFDFAFWSLYPNVLNAGEQCFNDLGDYFHISEEEKEEAEREAKDVILEALVNAREKGYNPFDDSKPFLLANLINQAKINALIHMICEKRHLNEEDFEHDAYDDGALLDVKYKEEIIA